MNPDKFWMIYVEGKNTPVVRHLDYETAKAECTRLARMETGKKVFLLEATQYCLAFESPVLWWNCESTQTWRGYDESTSPRQAP